MSDDRKTYDTSKSLSLSDWLGMFSYEKAHATMYGALLAFLAAIAASAYILSVFLAITLWALGIRGSPTRDTKTSDKKTDLEEEVAERTDDEAGSGLHAQILAEIRHTPHYFIGGGVIGDRLGYTAYWYTNGVTPDHYAQLPNIIETLLIL